MKYEKYYNEDVKKASDKKLFSVISCFAGGGGSSTGYRLAGGNILLVNEFVEAAIESYKENYPDTPVLVDDIKKYSGQDFLDMANIKSGELDILDGSPPCSAFSVAGKREKGWVGYQEDTRRAYFGDDGSIIQEGELKVKEGIKTYSDGKTVEGIEDLFLEYVRVAKDIQPKVIIAENVKGITFGEAQGKLFEFINSFEALGYQVTYKVLSAADYGTPQTRERTIFICIRDDVCDTIGLNILNLNGVFPDKTYSEHVSLAEGIDGVTNDPEQEKELFEYVQNGFQKKWIEMLPFNPTKHVKPSDKEYIDINPKRSLFNMIRPAPHLPCPTITQRGNQKSVSGVFHPALNRKFTIPELRRIMSLPEDYKLTGTFDKQAERIGRMVAPKMMAAIANSIYEKVLKPYNEVIK
jgi:DNA (cytosine-5)-methyltransferase 1